MFNKKLLIKFSAIVLLRFLSPILSQKSMKDTKGPFFSLSSIISRTKILLIPFIDINPKRIAPSSSEKFSKLLLTSGINIFIPFFLDYLKPVSGTVIFTFVIPVAFAQALMVKEHSSFSLE